MLDSVDLWRFFLLKGLNIVHLKKGRHYHGTPSNYHRMRRLLPTNLIEDQLRFWYVLGNFTQVNGVGTEQAQGCNRR